MEYSLLGQSDLSVSRIGFGCMSLGEDEAYNQRLLDTAIANGINYFDTADLYGKGSNEIMLGKVLKAKRQELIIATKVGNQLKQDGSGWVWNPRKAYIVKEVDNSLRRLQTDFIDLYQLHGGTMEDNIDEVIEAFHLLQQQGKIRYYGISSIRASVIRSYACRARICSVMMQYSLLDRRPEEACFDLLADKKISVLARGSLAGGLLIDKPAKAYLEYDTYMVNKAAEAIQAVSKGRRSATATALQFVWQQPVVAAAVVGMRTMEQLHEALQAMDSSPLDASAINCLRQSIPLNYYAAHR